MLLLLPLFCLSLFSIHCILDICCRKSISKKYLLIQPLFRILYTQSQALLIGVSIQAIEILKQFFFFLIGQQFYEGKKEVCCMLICCINVMYTYIDRQPSLSVGSMTLPIMQQQFTTKRATGGPFRALNFRCMVDVVLLCVNKKHGDSYTAYIWDFSSELFFSYFIFFLQISCTISSLLDLKINIIIIKQLRSPLGEKCVIAMVRKIPTERRRRVCLLLWCCSCCYEKDKWIINASMKKFLKMHFAFYVY